MDDPRTATNALASHGQDLLLRVGAGPQQRVQQLVRALLASYAEPTRGYHDTRHLTEILDRVDELALELEGRPHDLDVVRLAAWFHDAVHTASADPGADEDASARLAEASLPGAGVPAADVAEVARLVRLTGTHAPGPDDRTGAVLCDADLAVLARDPDGYAAYTAGVRQEYAHVPDAAFRAGRAAILSALVDRASLFSTATARERWEPAARRNVAAELATLRPR